MLVDDYRDVMLTSLLLASMRAAGNGRVARSRVSVCLEPGTDANPASSAARRLRGAHLKKERAMGKTLLLTHSSLDSLISEFSCVKLN
jgi:hypothetical protein